MENQVHVRLSNNGNENRNCSNLGVINGFGGVMREVGGDYRVHNHTETSLSAHRFTNHLNFTSVPSSSSRFMPTISEIVNEHVPKNVRSGKGDNSSRDEPPLKKNRDGDLKVYSKFNGLESQTLADKKARCVCSEKPQQTSRAMYIVSGETNK